MKKQKPHIKWGVLFSILLLPTILCVFLKTGDNVYEKLEVLYPQNTEGTNKKHHTIPDFSFINQDGVEITKEQLKNKVWIANFFFTTCPSICPVMNNNLVRVQRELKKSPEFKMLSFTVNPSYDTKGELKKYAKKIGANTANWHFLTGDKEKIHTLARQGMFLGANEDPKAEGGFFHSEHIVIIDKEGRIRSGKDKQGNIRAAYSGTSDVEIKELISDLKLLLAEDKLATKTK